jgi:DNA-binding transcriptional ArsR family regulator
MASRSDQALDAVFQALSDSTRRKMLKALASGDRRVSDLARPYPMSLAAASKHIRVLERAGLVTRLRIGSEHYIQLRTPGLARASKWISFYERFWSTHLEALEDLVAGKSSH